MVQAAEYLIQERMVEWALNQSHHRVSLLKNRVILLKNRAILLSLASRRNCSNLGMSLRRRRLKHGFAESPASVTR